MAPALIDGRFELAERVAAGGMGVVYRAIDTQTGERVALKLMQFDDPQTPLRFAREARVLAELSDPGIVRYVAHGVAAQGERYLAMEWLEGEDLATRLARGPMPIHEAVTLVAHVATALAAAHARGVVHRDIKPSNVFLPGGRTEAPKVLDFGVARLVGDASHLTRTGAAIGTPAYMSPEQVRGGAVDARADLFSLGCVLFECLAGRPPWIGQSAVAVMAKIVFEDAPRLGELRPGLPPALDELCARLLEKDRARRPLDAKSVAADLFAVRASTRGASTSASRPPAALTGPENRLVCVVLAQGGALDLAPAVDPYVPTLRTGDRDLAQLLTLADLHGARLEVLLDKSVAGVVSGAGPATDLSARAARLALALQAELPRARIALATGRTVVTSALPTGEVIEAASLLLSAAPPGRAGIRIDAATAGLLDLGFQIERDEAGSALLAAREVLETTRRLVGRPTPCVGRDRELSLLETTLGECIEDSVARAVLVTGPAGIGKSRVRHEFLARARAREVGAVWMARGDPMRRGSVFGLLAQVIRHAAGIREADPADAACDKLSARVALHHAGADAQRIAEFLGEICGAPFPGEGSLQLAAARQNAMLMGDQMRRAWEDFLAAECAAHPVVVVLDDLQWGDAPTVKFIDAALRHARDRPVLVLALARPEVEEAFPGLWAERGVMQLRLGELSAKASERLARAVLGPEASASTIGRVVGLAAGNAFYLEELIRAVAEGHGDKLPGSVLAMAQARLEALEDAPRRLLRAGSIFGETFWLGGVAALLGLSTSEAGASVEMLVERELVARHAESRFDAPGEQELVFRHSLLREAAYAMLTDHDRALGHRLAAEWLERAGEKQAVVLAQHFDRGGERGRAAQWFRRAAEQSLEANDLEAVLDHVARAERSGTRGDALASLRLLEATARHWRAEYSQGERAATEAVRGLAPLTAAWYRAVEEVAECALPLGKVEPLAVLGEALHPPPGARADASPFVVAGATLAIQLLLAGRHDAGHAVLDRVERAEASLAHEAPLVRARAHFARATRGMIGGDLGQMLTGAREAVEAFDEAGDVRSAALMRTNLAYAYLEIGAYDDAEQPLRVASSVGERIGLPGVVAAAQQNLGWVLARRGALDEARRVETECIGLCVANADQRMEGNSRIYLALTLALMGDLEAAEEQARLALARLTTIPPMRAYALGALAHVLLSGGRTDEALDTARQAMALVGQLGSIDEGEMLVRVTHVRALEAAGPSAEARQAARAGAALVAARAEKISDAAWKASFVERVPENAAMLELGTRLGAC